MAGSNAREETLARIRRALKSETKPEAASVANRRSSVEVLRACEQKRPALIAQFESELTKVGGRVHKAASSQAALEYIEEVASARRVTTIIGWTDCLLDGIDLQAHLKEEGIEFITESTDEAFIQTAAAAGIGVSGVDYALADTGTLVLLSREGRARSVSLLPSVHIALVRPEQVIEGLDDMFSLMRDGTDRDKVPSSAVTFITGPSRTADIELTLVVGVHGPQELHAILLG